MPMRRTPADHSSPASLPHHSSPLATWSSTDRSEREPLPRSRSTPHCPKHPPACPDSSPQPKHSQQPSEATPQNTAKAKSMDPNHAEHPRFQLPTPPQPAKHSMKDLQPDRRPQ